MQPPSESTIISNVEVRVIFASVHQCFLIYIRIWVGLNCWDKNYIVYQKDASERWGDGADV